MLRQINIQNFAIIDKMNINFNHGLTVITGQTGAGKSIVIDAIEQLLGTRASQSMIATNSEFAYIEGVFDITNEIITILNDNDYFIDDDYLFISKKIKSDGKSQIKLNNRITTNEIIRQLAPFLLEIHSQNASYALIDRSLQQKLINEMFNDSERKIYEDYQVEYKNYLELISEKQELFSKKIDPELLSFYKSQLKEIEDANLTKDQMTELTNKETYYKDYEKIAEHLKNIILLFNDTNVIESFNSINNEMDKLKTANDNFSTQAIKCEELYYNLLDFFEIMKEEYQTLSFDEEEYEIIKEKLYNYQKMIKKYGYSQDELHVKITELNNNINFILNSADLVNDLEEKITLSKNQLTILADQLTIIRRKYCQIIEEKIIIHLKELYLKDAKFKIELEKTDFSNQGQEKVNFLFSANKGNDLRPLNLVASGGELSRLMLALKIVSFATERKMYIFDEIDIGVSGEVADAVGRKIKEISLTNDVICITHLPQVAVYADNNLYIEKTTNKQYTTSNYHYLDNEEKVAEIGKMLSGDTLTTTALEHAKELINNAKIDD